MDLPTPSDVQRFCRDELAYRSVAPPGAAPVRACGFILREQGDGRPVVRGDQGEYVLVYVLAGQGQVSLATGRPIAVRAGDAVQIVAGAALDVQPLRSERWAETFVQIDGRFVSELARLGSLNLQRPVLMPGLTAAIAEQFDRILHALAHGPDNSIAWTLLQAHQLVVDLHQRDTSDPDAIETDVMEQACRRLSSDFDQKVTDDMLADELGIPLARFRRLFVQRVGMDPNSYRQIKRIDHARALLAEGKLKVQQIAGKLGFEDAATFSRQFRRLVGRSPQTINRPQPVER